MPARRSISASAPWPHELGAAARGHLADRPARLGRSPRLIEEPALARCQRRAPALATRQLVERRGHALAAARLVSSVAVLLRQQQALVAEARVLEGAMRRYVGDMRQKIERTTDSGSSNMASACAPAAASF
jgi:hypothetical protein